MEQTHMFVRYRVSERGRKRLSVLQSARGFSLVEAIVTVVLFSIIGGACFAIFLSGADSWQVNSVKLELQQELRKAADWMRQDLWEAGVSTITNVPADGSWHTTITFRVSNGVSGGNILWSTNTIQFLLGGTNNSQLQRQSGAQTKILAQDMQTLQFRRQATTPNILEMSFAAQKRTTKGALLTQNTTFKITLRN